MPAFYLLGVGIYSIYEVSFERRGDTSLRGLSFFFGLLFITEVTLVLVFGVDYRLVDAPYIGPSLHFGVIELPLRLLVPCLVSLAMLGVLQTFLSRSFLGRAVQAVAQDPQALRLMAANPTRIKRVAFGLSIATASIAGAVLIIIQPIEPSIGRDYIGRIFAIVRAGRPGQHQRHAGRRAHLGHRREPDRDVLRSLLVAGRRLRHPAAHARGAAQRPVRARLMTQHRSLSPCSSWPPPRSSPPCCGSATATSSSPATSCCNTSCWRRRGTSSAATPAT